MSTTSFSSFDLHPALLQNLTSLGYAQTTAIQAQSLGPILAGKDVIAQAKTGSGKTAAFGLGLLQCLNVKRFRVQALILCPTRELADQVAKEIRKLARAIHNIKVLTLCGGMPMGPQIGSLEHGAHILVGTPGRIEDHIRKGRIDASELKMLVLDEADRMLDMGFQDSLDAITESLPKARQTLLFSATYPDEIQNIAKRVMRDPVIVKVEQAHTSKTISEHFYKLHHSADRLDALRLVLLHHQPESSIVFCTTKRDTQDVADALLDFGFSAVALHGDLEQKDRDKTLVRFANKSVSILVATDVAARGLDIDSVEAVINYHISRNPEVHTHRIGRTGRAGKNGIACSLFTEREAFKLAQLDSDKDPLLDAENLPSNAVLKREPLRPEMVTIQIDGGKRAKVRPGDILGALTGENGIAGTDVGKIQIYHNSAFVAVHRRASKQALEKLQAGKLKGRSFKSRLVRR